MSGGLGYVSLGKYAMSTAHGTWELNGTDHVQARVSWICGHFCIQWTILTIHVHSRRAVRSQMVCGDFS